MPHIHALCVSEWVKWRCSVKLSLFSTLGKNKPNRRVIVISYTSAYVDASGRRTQPPSVCDAETEEKRQRNRESVDIVFFVSFEFGNGQQQSDAILNRRRLFWEFSLHWGKRKPSCQWTLSECSLKKWPHLPWALIAPHLKSPITSLHTAPRRRSALSCRAARRVFQRCIKVWRLNKKAPVLQIRVDDKIKL